jgi:hypothetical protein
MAERGTFSLPAGHQLRVEELWQWKTYRGLLVGMPTDGINRALVASAVEEGRTRWGGEPFLLPPTARLIEYGDPPEAEVAPTLPAIVCLARFEYHPSYSNALRGRPAEQWPAIMSTLRTKVLTVVWFQDDFAFPIEPPIYEQILAIDWERCGENKPED